MGDTFLASLLQRLDFVVIERLPSGSLRFETPAPRWFVDVATTASGGDPVTLGGALPFVHHVLEVAEAFWWSGKDGVATGDPFVASGAGEEYLLRPRAVSLSGRKLLGYQYDIEKRVIGMPIRAETADILSKMLARSLETESSDALVTGYRIVGKTGTAEIPTPFGYTTNETNASFVGWGPIDDPRFLVYV